MNGLLPKNLFQFLYHTISHVQRRWEPVYMDKTSSVWWLFCVSYSQCVFVTIIVYNDLLWGSIELCKDHKKVSLTLGPASFYTDINICSVWGMAVFSIFSTLIVNISLVVIRLRRSIDVEFCSIDSFIEIRSWSVPKLVKNDAPSIHFRIRALSWFRWLWR